MELKVSGSNYFPDIRYHASSAAFSCTTTLQLETRPTVKSLLATILALCKFNPNNLLAE